MSNVNEPSTIHSIQFLRAVAALLVVLFHAQQAFTNAGSPPAFELESYLFSFGAVGVHLFFVISGFIMIHTMRPDSFSSRKFLRRRLIRIYPIYWACVAIYISTHVLIGRSYDLDWAPLVGALLLFPGNAPYIIGPAWTLSFEMYFYIAFSLFMSRGLFRGLVAMSIFFLMCITIRPFIGLSNPMLNLVGNVLLLEFVGGAAIGYLAKTNLLPKRGGRITVILAAALFLVGIAYGFDRAPGVISWGIPSILLVMGVVQVEFQSGSSEFVRKFGLLGDASYVLYLIHILVITVLLELSRIAAFDKSIEPAIAAILIGLVTSFVAIGLHRYVERPMLRFLNPKRSLVPQREKVRPEILS